MPVTLETTEAISELQTNYKVKTLLLQNYADLSSARSTVDVLIMDYDIFRLILQN